jgi:RsiW-degrading membrane proteinase PrsW (M82 family)
MFLLLFVSIFPVVVLLFYFYWRDKYEKEPFTVMLKAFAGGIFSVVGAVLLSLLIIRLIPVPQKILYSSLFVSFFHAAFPEELFKFLFLYWFIWKNKNFNEYYDGILYAVYVSLGFACMENIGYVFQFGIPTGIARAFSAVPGHALFGVIMGYYFSLAKFIPEYKKKYLLKSLFYAILAHGIWDFLIFMAAGLGEISSPLSGLMVITFFIFIFKLYKICLRRIKLHIDASCFKGTESALELSDEEKDTKNEKKLCEKK